MYCWGSNKYGQLGLGGVEEEIFYEPKENKFFSLNTTTTTTTTTLTASSSSSKYRLKQIACGYNHTLFLLDDGTILSCGNNDYEQLGHDLTRTKPEFVKSLELQFIIQISCGHSYSLALTNRGQLYCWGSICGNRENSSLFFAKPT